MVHELQGFPTLLWQQELFPGGYEFWGLFSVTLTGGSSPSLGSPDTMKMSESLPRSQGGSSLAGILPWELLELLFHSSTPENLGSAWTHPSSPKACKLSPGKSRAHLVFPYLSGIAVPCCPLSYVLNTIASYVLSSILVLPCRSIKMIHYSISTGKKPLMHFG